MKILLLGEFSNVHTTLAKGLRQLGHEVTLASDGDGWKDYPRDVDLRRPSLGALSSAAYFCRLIKQFRQFRGYDIVQLINPIFLPLRAERMGVFYKYLRRTPRSEKTRRDPRTRSTHCGLLSEASLRKDGGNGGKAVCPVSVGE